MTAGDNFANGRHLESTLPDICRYQCYRRLARGGVQLSEEANEAAKDRGGDLLDGDRIQEMPGGELSPYLTR